MRITTGIQSIKEHSRRRVRRSLAWLLSASALWVWVWVGLVSGQPAQAGDLVFFEASVGPGGIRAISQPASNVLLDIDYAPASAEGSGLFGFSEAQIIATGDLTLTISGFSCSAYQCLYYPLPFRNGKSILVTGGSDLNGEIAAELDLMTISTSGTNGYVALISGNYLDATGPLGAPGAVQSLEPTILAAVPEPHIGLGLAIGGLVLVTKGRRKQPIP
jgi:hypothetical protein